MFHDTRFAMESVPGASEYALKRFLEGAKAAAVLSELRAMHLHRKIGKSGFYRWFQELKKANQLGRGDRFRMRAEPDEYFIRLESLISRLEALLIKLESANSGPPHGAK